MTIRKGLTALAAVLAAFLSQATPALASSHREAPAITKRPKVDGTDFYMFRSYETGRAGYTTLLANYIPLQDVYGGPNFFMLDPDAVYEIHIDNNGDALRDVTFQFRFQNTIRGLTVPVGGQSIPIPLINIGGVGPGAGDNANLNVIETYSLGVIRGRNGRPEPVTLSGGGTSFLKPVDRIGDKSIRDNNPTVYGLYADDHIYDVTIPGCSGTARVFVGQRREGFVFNLAESFDLINLNPVGARNSRANDLSDKNVTTLALEVPTSCLALPGQPVIGGWTTASISKNDRPESFTSSAGPNGPLVQVSRLGNALVNEIVIGLPDKDRFNASEPKDDAQFARYVTNPSFPKLIELLFPSKQAPTLFPRTDLVAVFLTGVPLLNQPPNVVPSEMLRLNTSIAPRTAGTQDSLGVLANDQAGYPNGRRPGDDVIDITLRVAMGALLPASVAPNGQEPYTDGALVTATIGYTPDGNISGDPAFRLFRDQFPYLQTPLSGSPQPIHP